MNLVSENAWTPAANKWFNFKIPAFHKTGCAEMRNKKVVVKTTWYPHAFPLQNESMQWTRLSLLWKSFIALHYGQERPTRWFFTSLLACKSFFCTKKNCDATYIFPLKPPAKSNKVWQFTLFIQGLIKVHWASQKSLISYAPAQHFPQCWIIPPIKMRWLNDWDWTCFITRIWQEDILRNTFLLALRKCYFSNDTFK